MRIPDPIEQGEARAERWAETHLRDNDFKCLKCEEWFPIDSGVTMTIDPYSPLVCWDCSGFSVQSKDTSTGPTTVSLGRPHDKNPPVAADLATGRMRLGDYVLVTKYSDGDPGDQYAVGFLKSIDIRHDIRFMVVDGEGKSFRGNGFRRCEPITDAEGRWLIEHFPDFKLFEHGEDEFGNDVRVGWSVWDWLAHYRNGRVLSV